MTTNRDGFGDLTSDQRTYLFQHGPSNPDGKELTQFCEKFNRVFSLGVDLDMMRFFLISTENGRRGKRKRKAKEYTRFNRVPLHQRGKRRRRRQRVFPHV